MATEKRLIDANHYDQILDKREMKLMEYSGSISCAIKGCRDILAQEPTVDAVEVVRCGECKHGIWDEEEQMWECIVSVDLTGDPDTYAMFHEYNDGDHFCSYGERKDNG